MLILFNLGELCPHVQEAPKPQKPGAGSLGEGRGRTSAALRQELRPALSLPVAILWCQQQPEALQRRHLPGIVVSPVDSNKPKRLQRCGLNGHGWETTPKRVSGCPLPTTHSYHLSRASTSVIWGGRAAQLGGLNLPSMGRGKQHPSFRHQWAPCLSNTAVRLQPSKCNSYTSMHKHTGCTESLVLHLKHIHIFIT